MVEIRGTVNTALCFAKEVEEGAMAQIQRLCSYDLSAGSKIRIMPDVHEGKGCTIGTTMTVHDKVCPNLVGVDIGCGMYTVQLAEKKIDFAAVDDACHWIPSGKGVWEGRMERFDLGQLRCFRSLRDTKRLERSLGTLGGGNHFIEIDQAKDGTYYLIIHSGSRNLGKQVAELYQQLAIDLHSGKETYFLQREVLIASYKAAGRRKEIAAALKALAAQAESRKPDVPEDLCWLYGTYLEDYLHDVAICQLFARRNREKMAELLLERTHLTAVQSFHTVHNYIDVEEMILRKGAIAARKGELVLIPMNMRDGCLLAVGKGNDQWNQSAPHGAGRRMSRTQAKERLDMDTYRMQMEGIYTTSVQESTLDEAPMAYKPMEEVMEQMEACVEVLEVLHPVFNFKASEWGGDGKRREAPGGEKC